MSFRLISDYKPTGDQPKAIEALVNCINAGQKAQVLLGVTGSGKTFTVANVIEKVQKPPLVIAHNKTLAAQLYQEFKEFFPENSVNYFVSYYDYYQPEAYIPRTDTYIEKETQINEEIDKLRLQTTRNLLTRNDVIVVASVSCIYNLGNPEEYQKATLNLNLDSIASLQNDERKKILEKLIDLQYVRNEIEFKRGTFRITGETIDIYPSYDDYGIRIENKTLSKFDPMTGVKIEDLEKYDVYPAKHFMTSAKNFTQIKLDLEEQCKKLPLLEAQRLKSRVTYDLEMIQEVGYVNGIENYSRYFDGRKPGDPPNSLLEFFPKDYLLIIDESHMSIPQIRGMYNGDQSRKQTLVDYGFRLPSALDNRPLRFDEFQRRMGQTIFTSATPNEWEISLAKQSYIDSHSREIPKQVRDDTKCHPDEGQDLRHETPGVVEKLVRPTGLVDPEIEVRTSKNQVLDLTAEIKIRVERGERVLVTTLTKRLAEDLAAYLENEQQIKVAYLHSDIETGKRTDILRRLRLGEYDVLVGINLLREGLDLPEVSLVAILDADKEGFLRSQTSLVQTMGRAARHISGQVIMYADTVTKSMDSAIKEINRRRKFQLKFNHDHHIFPASIIKPIRENILADKNKKIKNPIDPMEIDVSQLTPKDKAKLKQILEKRMKESAKILDFEGAGIYRDKIKSLMI